MNNKRIVLGICGCIGSGKSEVLNILKKQGWFVIDADKVVHRLYESGQPGQRKIVDFFGEEFVGKDGGVDRKKLRKVVFNDTKKLKILNALIHPLVFNEISKILDVEKDESNVAIEAVYFEDKFLKKLVDKIFLVKRPLSEIKSFLVGELKFSVRMVENLVNTRSIPDEINSIIDNNSTLNELEKKVIIEVEKLIL